MKFHSSFSKNIIIVYKVVIHSLWNYEIQISKQELQWVLVFYCIK